MALLEEADKTSEYLETMSSLFRYNIKQINLEVKIEEEIKNIMNYYKLLKTRFGELFRFEFEIDENTLNYKIPPLTLQPLVENAYIHGLSMKEEGGNILIKTVKTDTDIIIIIKDNGKGIPKSKLSKIIDKNSQYEEESGNGIGLRNVIDRLELYYKKEGIVSIDSELEKGTKIEIKIPNEVLEW